MKTFESTIDEIFSYSEISDLLNGINIDQLKNIIYKKDYEKYKNCPDQLKLDLKQSLNERTKLLTEIRLLKKYNAKPKICSPTCRSEFDRILFIDSVIPILDFLGHDLGTYNIGNSGWVINSQGNSKDNHGLEAGSRLCRAAVRTFDEEWHYYDCMKTTENTFCTDLYGRVNTSISSKVIKDLGLSLYSYVAPNAFSDVCVSIIYKDEDFPTKDKATPLETAIYLYMKKRLDKHMIRRDVIEDIVIYGDEERLKIRKEIFEPLTKHNDNLMFFDVNERENTVTLRFEGDAILYEDYRQIFF